MSCADLLGHEPLQAPGEDRDEGDLDEGDEVFLRPLDDGVQSAVARDPAEGALRDPRDLGGDEYAVAPSGDRPDGDAERLPGFGQALAAIAEVADGRPLEAAAGNRSRDRDDAFGVVPSVLTWSETAVR